MRRLTRVHTRSVEEVIDIDGDAAKDAGAATADAARKAGDATADAAKKTAEDVKKAVTPQH